MGFKMPRTVRIVFADGIYAGAEVVCRVGITLRESLEFADLESASSDDPKQAVALIEKFFEIAIVEWNLEEEDGTAIPVTPATLADQPGPFVVQLIEQWKEATQATPKASTDGSPNGKPSAELLEAMVQSSVSLSN